MRISFRNNALASFALLTILAVQPAAAKPLRNGGKLLLTNGITSLEGASGGGIAAWATIAGNETRDGIGVSGHATVVEVTDYDYQSAGISIGLFDRLELSYARQNFNTNEVGGVLGIGNDYAFDQDIYGAKLRLVGDLVYDSPILPAIAVGMQYKKNHDAAVIHAVGATKSDGIDYYVAATKLILSRSILLNATARMTKANQLGLLGFGGDRHGGYSLQFEGSAAWQLSRRLVIGGEYRTKPDNLGFAKEDDWFDAFAAYAINRNLTAAVAYTDLGSIATVSGQRGAFLSLQAAF